MYALCTGMWYYIPVHVHVNYMYALYTGMWYFEQIKKFLHSCKEQVGCKYHITDVFGMDWVWVYTFTVYIHIISFNLC